MSQISLEGFDNGSQGKSSSVGEDSVVVEGEVIQGNSSSGGELLSGLDSQVESDDSSFLSASFVSDVSLDGFESDTEGSGVSKSGVSFGV